MTINLYAYEKATIQSKLKRMKPENFVTWFETSPIKNRLKKAHMLRQEMRCAYCYRNEKSDNNNLWDLDHILCEVLYPILFAEADNFTLTCKTCNRIKGRKDVLHSHYPRPLTHVPQPEEAYEIPHPQKTVWTDHLMHTCYLVYEGKSPRGDHLIDVCDLNRDAERKAGMAIGSVRIATEEKLFQSWTVPLPTGSTITGEVAQYAHKREAEDRMRAAPALKRLQDRAAAEDRKAARALAKLRKGKPKIKTMVKLKPSKDALPQAPDRA